MGQDTIYDLFKAMEIVSNKQIQGLKFDRTIICTIVETQTKDNKYLVTDGSSTFYACSSNSYKIKDMVYILIPEGNFNNDKLIIGKVGEFDKDNSMNVNVENKTLKFQKISSIENYQSIEGISF